MLSTIEGQKPERLKEGWVEFVRAHFRGITIDTWMGDMADDPNSDSKSRISLCAMVTYFRINNGKWVRKKDLKS